ncbi:MAG: response regulator, partial [Chloroflexi bacterium]|nr:response regulator [Chloroflexota bacterium]
MSAENEKAAVLVVEDDEGSRHLLIRRLERRGMAVCSAENGKAALEMLRERPFDLVLLDIMMPVVDGYCVLAEMKASETWRSIPVIMLTAVTDIDSVVRCIQMGADDYLTKPLNPVLLQARMDACLEKKQLRDREARLYTELRESYARLQELDRLRTDLT